MLRDLREQEFQILVGVHEIRFCSLDKTVEDGTRLRTVGGLDEYEVLSSDGERPDGLLTGLS